MIKSLEGRVVQNWYHDLFGIYLYAPERKENPDGKYWVIIMKNLSEVYRENLYGVTEHEAIVRARNVFGLLQAPSENERIGKKGFSGS